MEANYTTPPVLIVGDSGTGKSTASGTLPPDQTVILNTEVKMMPYANHGNFKVMDIDAYATLKDTLTLLASADGQAAFKYVVLDSFTSMTEIVERWANANYSGFSVWRNYNEAIGFVIRMLKKLPQQVFVIGIPENKDAEFGNTKEYLRVKGKELKFSIEKEFSIVLFTSPVYEEESGEMIDVEMIFRPNNKNSAKTPLGLFIERPKNDMLAIATRIKEFYDV